MSVEINNLIANAEVIADEIQAEFGELSIEQLNWKPDENIWSIGQCFDHLITVNEQYFVNIQKVADGTHANNFYSRIPLFTDVVGKLFKKAVSPDSKKKIKNPAVFSPSMSDIAAIIIEDFGTNQVKFIALIEAVKNFDLKNIKIASPISDVINIRLIDAFEIAIMHEKRHLNQAKRVMEAEGFPK